MGKVPDPKGQVEQVTIALTYKFMDDMDLQAVKFGGKRRFFAGDFKEYAWSKLMDPSIGAQRMLHLYSNGIERMSDNPGAASLFRTIFANAFLPYNDPSTLQQFLRIINEFEYHNSESLGDAYEYLTSIMGSQGGAGQFRTPRHIIDFIVDIVDPKLNERILDPACGTGGFLISAYKHIIAVNSKADGTTTLTPYQLEKLSDNLKGYDIDPGMVRIALLNMYLHELVDPHIYEYDTLTSEARWNDDADVIIANPPFMTPKGGIRPHSRFSVQSKRSEVLFVDYMAEHLTSSGRAGIIVPEGIIFQTQNAHKQLRKMLVDEYLAAVISLPGGVFNPYSGVKTSILILDKALARKSDSIGFFKVNNDGYDLGAQRRPIDQNDIPQVRTDVQEYLRRARGGEPTTDWHPATGQVVRRDKIAEDGEYNLSGERYRVRTVRSTKWPMVRLGDVAEVIAGQSPPGSSYNEAAEGEPFHQGKSEFGNMYIGEAVKWTTDPRRYGVPGDIIMSVRAPVGPVNLTKTKICIGRGLAAIRPNASSLCTEFAFHALRYMQDEITGSGGSAFDSISIKVVSQLEIPLPSLDAQREVADEIEGYQRVIDGARMVVENWRPRIKVDPAWTVVELGEVCDVVNGGTPKSDVIEFWDGGIPWITLADLPANEAITEISKTVRTISDDGLRKSSATMVPVDSVVVSSRATIGRVGITRIPLSTNQGFRSCVIKNGEVSAEYLALALINLVPTMQAWASGSTYKEIIKSRFVRLPTPLPPKHVQAEVVASYATEAAAIAANRDLMVKMEERIREVVARVWG